MAKKLFIGNLSWKMTNQDLRNAFSSYGEIEDAVIVTDRETGRSRGFGFVTFVNDSDGDAAVAGMNGKEIGGRAISANEARPRE